jgi:Cu(I)/Ag(I) efflux system membrane fusion protein
MSKILFVDTTGQNRAQREHLFRVYSPDIQQALADLLVVSAAGSRARRLHSRASTGQCAGCAISAFGKSESRNCVESGVNPRTIDWPSPASGTIISKRIINGQADQCRR